MHRLALRLLLVLAAILAFSPAAHAASPGLVVSQVYAGGGNTGATYANDYVELFNRGSSAVDLTGWTVQYATSAGTAWQPTALSGSVQPGKHYLVQLASSAAIGAALPTADATGTSNLAVSGGKVAIVHDTAALTCGASAGSCSAVATVADLVGYGAATDYEGSAAAPSLSATSALVRAGAGCTDTDANATDFTAAAPSPSNSAVTAAACSTPVASVGADAAVDVQIDPVLSLALERPTVSFGHAVSGDAPAAVSEKVTVVSNNAAGYSLTVHRSAFAPADLPLGISIGGAALVPIPVTPALDLLVASSTARSAAGGDVWTTSLGFPALPTVAPGTYTSTVTFTVIGR